MSYDPHDHIFFAICSFIEVGMAYEVRCLRVLDLCKCNLLVRLLLSVVFILVKSCLGLLLKTELNQHFGISCNVYQVYMNCSFSSYFMDDKIFDETMSFFCSDPNVYRDRCHSLFFNGQNHEV
jgi:hypothetical protein